MDTVEITLNGPLGLLRALTCRRIWLNPAEYTGMDIGIQAALDHNVSDLIIVGNSRLAIQQYTKVIACKKDSLQVKLAYHRN
uniref:RNase H type-1 domain-containing protein n=1 Tax=Hyaloperonospora arabidopsidis (strain Emoy2) TaxID=559515 RepID=M4BQD0_HYAAE